MRAACVRALATWCRASTRAVIDLSSSAVLLELPKPSAFALRAIERHRGTFEESLPTLRFTKPRARAQGERIELAELAQVVPAGPMVVAAPAPVEPAPVEPAPVEPAPVEPAPSLVALPEPVCMPAPIVRGHTQPYRPVPVRRAAPPDWLIVLACWLASFVLAATLWIATA